MMGGSRNRCVIVAFVLAVSAGPAVKDATAGKKPKLVARVNNKGFRASLRASIVGAYSPAGVTLNDAGLIDASRPSAASMARSSRDQKGSGTLSR